MPRDRCAELKSLERIPVLLPQSGNLPGKRGEPGAERPGEGLRPGVGGGEGGFPAARGDFDDGRGALAEACCIGSLAADLRLRFRAGEAPRQSGKLKAFSSFPLRGTELAVLRRDNQAPRRRDRAADAHGSAGADCAGAADRAESAELHRPLHFAGSAAADPGGISMPATSGWAR